MFRIQIFRTNHTLITSHVSQRMHARLLQAYSALLVLRMVTGSSSEREGEVKVRPFQAAKTTNFFFFLPFSLPHHKQSQTTSANKLFNLMQLLPIFYSYLISQINNCEKRSWIVQPNLCSHLYATTQSSSCFEYACIH